MYITECYDYTYKIHQSWLTTPYTHDFMHSLKTGLTFYNILMKKTHIVFKKFILLTFHIPE